jgi:hypothetical protein
MKGKKPVKRLLTGSWVGSITRSSTAALLVKAGLAVVSSPPDGDVVDFD